MLLPCESLVIAKRWLCYHSFVLFFPRLYITFFHQYIAFFSSIYCYFLVYILRFPIPYTLIICQVEMHISENEVMRLGLHI